MSYEYKWNHETGEHEKTNFGSIAAYEADHLETLVECTLGCVHGPSVVQAARLENAIREETVAHPIFIFTQLDLFSCQTTVFDSITIC